MKITNKYGLPRALHTYAIKNEYDKGAADVSVTGLLRPPRQAALMDSPGAGPPPSRDLSDMGPALWGTMWHKLMEDEAHEDPDIVAEQRLFMRHSDLIISGQIDALERAEEGWRIEDWKTTGVWGMIYSGLRPKTEWVQQLNIYATLAEANGFGPITDLRIQVFIRDWQPEKALRDEKYPDKMFMPLEVDLWSRESRDLLISMRAKMYQEALVELPLCTSEERWERDRKFKVLKEGRKKSLRNLDSQEDAEAWMAAKKVDRPNWKLSIEHTPGRQVRCENYCPVSHNCHQWQQIQKAQQL